MNEQLTYEQMVSIIRTFQGNREALARYLSTPEVGGGSRDFCRREILRYYAKQTRKETA